MLRMFDATSGLYLKKVKVSLARLLSGRPLTGLVENGHVQRYEANVEAHEEGPQLSASVRSGQRHLQEDEEAS